MNPKDWHLWELHGFKKLRDNKKLKDKMTGTRTQTIYSLNCGTNRYDDPYHDVMILKVTSSYNAKKAVGRVNY